jgi:beta-phosphoglucomutase-like phosphatase (HAD superfamily)
VKRLPARRPAAIIFDMDGVILDTERLDRDIWRSVATRLGLEFSDSLHDRMIGMPRRDTTDLLRGHFAEHYDPAMQAAKEMWRAMLTGGRIPYKTGVLELLALLEAAAIPKAIATSTERRRALKFLGSLLARFGALACGDEVPTPKPAPDVYLLAASRLGVPARDCIAIEDSPVGYAAAEAAGMMPILIPDFIYPSAPPLYTCDSLLDVLEWLQSGSSAEARFRE